MHRFEYYKERTRIISIYFGNISFLFTMLCLFIIFISIYEWSLRVAIPVALISFQMRNVLMHPPHTCGDARELRYCE